MLGRAYTKLLDKMTSVLIISNGLRFDQSRTTEVDFRPVSEFASDVDRVIGKPLKMSILQSQQLANLWNSLVDWVLGVGRAVAG